MPQSDEQTQGSFCTSELLHSRKASKKIQINRIVNNFENGNVHYQKHGRKHCKLAAASDAGLVVLNISFEVAL